MSEHKVKPGRGVRHGDVARDLLDGISSGRFPVGSLLPKELELCELYGTSRHTVRLAITELLERGLVSRRKRTGTRVEARSAPARYRQSLGSLDDLVQFGEEHVRVLQDTGEVVMTVALAEALGIQPGSHWLRISSLRLNRGDGAVPVGWTDVYVDAAYTDLPARARAVPDTLVATLIEQAYGHEVVEIRQDVTAVALPAHLAAALQAEAGSPALRLVRRYFAATGALIEISDTIHPADRFTASSRLTRGRSGVGTVSRGHSPDE